MSRILRALGTLALTAVLVALSAPSASAHTGERLGDTLGRLWTTVLELPADENPFTAEGKQCVDISDPQSGSVVTPFAPVGTSHVDCTIMSDTRIFISAFSSECSNAEAKPYFGRDERDLRKCALKVDSKVNEPVVTLDGRRVPLSEVTTPLLTPVMPEDNILGAPAGETVLSVGHGWVAFVGPFAPGQYTIELRTTGTYLKAPIDNWSTTVLTVVPG